MVLVRWRGARWERGGDVGKQKRRATKDGKRGARAIQREGA